MPDKVPAQPPGQERHLRLRLLDAAFAEHILPRVGDRLDRVRRVGLGHRNELHVISNTPGFFRSCVNFLKDDRQCFNRRLH